jgi:hypothetical protein
MGMIEINESTSEIGGGKYINIDPETAISEGRYLKSLEVGKLDNGNCYLDVVIRDNQDKIANRRYFEPSMGGWVDSEEKLKKETNKLIKVITNLIRRFRGNTAKVSGNTWEEVFNNVKALITGTPGWQALEMRVKLILKEVDINGDTVYLPTLPGYAPIFEDTSVSIEKSALKINKNLSNEIVSVPTAVSITPDKEVGGTATVEDVDF